MDTGEIHDFLYKMKRNEIEHKFHPEKAQYYWASLKQAYSLDNKPVYLFKFDEIFRKEREKTLLVSDFYHLDGTSIFISQHSRYSIVPLHIHDYIEINYVYDGDTTAIINGSRIQLKKGDVCLLDTGCPHTILETTENDIIVNFLISKEYFSLSFINRLLYGNIISSFLIKSLTEKRNHNQYLLFHSQDNDKLRNIIELIIGEQIHIDLCYQEIINGLMIVFFSELIRTYSYQEFGLNDDNLLINKIVKYVENNYADCSLEKMSELFSYSPNYLSGLIKKSTGKTYKRLIQEQRLKNAAVLLKNTDWSIDKISKEIGYKNIGFFYKKFEQYFKVKPRKYRDKH